VPLQIHRQANQAAEDIAASSGTVLDWASARDARSDSRRAADATAVSLRGSADQADVDHKTSKGAPMPIIIVQEVAADPNGLEQFAAGNQETVRAILEAAKKQGLIAHRFYGSEDERRC
jgi:hypothetical protein